MSRNREDFREQVGLWIRIRRTRLKLTQRELAERAGIRSLKTLTNAEGGTSELRQNVGEVEDVLGWPQGSLTRAYRYGVEPTPVDIDIQPEPERRAPGEQLLDAMQEQLDALRQELRRQYLPEPPPDDTRKRPAG